MAATPPSQESACGAPRERQDRGEGAADTSCDEGVAATTAWILARRPARNVVDARKPSAFLVEDERAESGEIVRVATIFLTSRECPWRCLMCDLWRNTLTESVPPGAIPEQIDFALTRLRGLPLQRRAEKMAGRPTPLARSPLERPATIKLYNAGSFFDARAIPPEDFPAIAGRVRGFERVIVECHPSLVGDSALRFRDLLSGKLEVAMGLETVETSVLEKLNKRMTLASFAKAAAFLRAHDIALRVFILVKPPFLDEAAALHWARRSIDFAFTCGASVVSLIPTRAGNGALEALGFVPPKLATLEAAHDYGIGLQRGRVFADLWDLEKFSECAICFPARRERLWEMNAGQTVRGRIACSCEAPSQAVAAAPSPQTAGTRGGGAAETSCDEGVAATPDAR